MKYSNQSYVYLTKHLILEYYLVNYVNFYLYLCISTQLPVVLLPGGRPPQQLFVLLVLLSNFFLSSSQVICPPQKKFVNS